MSVIKTFLDSSVLIAAATGRDAVRLPALRVLADPSRWFWYSPLVELEVLPKALYNGRKDEAGFYRAYFSEAECYGDLNRTYEIGRKEAERHGIAAIDALHLAAANLARCGEFITVERRTKPIFRSRLVKVLTLDDVPE